MNSLKNYKSYLPGPGWATARTVLSGMAVSILVLGCSSQKATKGGFHMPPTPVETARATTQTVEDKFDAIGTIEADESVSIVSQIDGAIVKLPFEEGSAVKRGQLIAQLDDSQLAAEAARAEAVQEQSKTSYDRIKAIVDQNAGSLQDLDDALAALKVAEANLALAKANLAKTKIVAPFDGLIGVRHVSVGTYLKSGQAITEMANIDNIRVLFPSPESYLSRLIRGAEVTVSTTAFPDKIKGKISAVEPVIDPDTRNAMVVARVSNPERKFRPGMSADVEVVLSERTNALTVPSEAVFASGNQSFVFMVKPDSTVARVGVELGTRMSDAVEVVSGLDPGDMIVTAGHQKLYDGARIFAIPSQGSPSAAQQNKSSN